MTANTHQTTSFGGNVRGKEEKVDCSLDKPYEVSQMRNIAVFLGPSSHLSLRVFDLT